jgi:hypothetical protein
LRFEIRDLLAATLIVAMILLVVRSDSQVRRRSLDIAGGEKVMQLLESEIAQEHASLENAAARFDYYREVADIHEAALGAFAEIEAKSRTLVPKPGWISCRRVPYLKENTDQTNWAYRISVPAEEPVYLRSAIAPIDSIPSKGRSELDRQPWLNSGPLVDSAAHEVRLAPGIHDLIITTHRGRSDAASAEFEIRLDGQSIFKSKTIEESFEIGSTMSTSPQEQYDFRFDKRSAESSRFTEFLVSVEIEEPNTGVPKQRIDFDFWVWLSGTPMPKSFTKYSLGSDKDE